MGLVEDRAAHRAAPVKCDVPLQARNRTQASGHRFFDRRRGLAPMLTLAFASAMLASSALATTLTVTSSADSGAGSLRNAITQANGLSGSVTINFQSGLGALTVASALPSITNASGITIDSTGVTGGIPGTSGLLIAAGSGTVTLVGSNSYLGGTTLNSGLLLIASDNSLGNPGGSLSLGAGLATSATMSSARPVALTNNARLNVAPSTTLTLGGAISGSYVLQKNNAGTLVLSGNNSAFSGTLRLNAGTLQVGASTNLGAGTLYVAGGVFQGTSSFTAANQVTLAAASQFDVVSGAALTLGGVISGSGGLTKLDSGTLNLTGTNTYGGGTTISAGTLSVSQDANLGAAAGGLTLSGGTFASTGTFSSARAVSLTANSSIDVASAQNLTLSGVISGTGSLTKLDTGTLTLTGAETYTGGTTVSAGTLMLDTGGSLQSNGALTVNAGGTFNDNGHVQTIGNLNGAGQIQLGSGVLTVTTNAADTFSGVISGPGSLVKAGTTTLALSGTNTYNGGTTIAAGTLSVSQDANLGDAAGNLTLSGGTLAATGTFTSARNVSLTSTSSIDVSASKTLTLTGAISGSGGLTKVDTGTLTLTGTNTYTGGTFINGGTVSASSLANLGGSAAGLSFASGTLKLADAFDLSLSAPIAIASSGGTIDTNGFNSTVSTAINGAGRLTKTGAGTLTLTAADSYAGGTTVNGGTLQVGADSALGSGSQVTLASATLATTATFTMARNISGNGTATLDVASGTTLTLSGVLSGSLTKQDGGTLILTKAGNNAGASLGFFGGTVVADSANELGTSTTILGFRGGVLATTKSFTLAGKGAMLGLGNIDVAAGTTLTLTGVFQGSGRLSFTNTGTAVTTASNTYSGGTTIMGATLQIGNGGTSGSIQGDVLDNGTLAFNHTNDVTFAGVVSGTGGIVQMGTGILTLTGANTYLGGTVVSGGTVQINADNGLGDASGGLALNGGTLIANQAPYTSTRNISLGSGGGSFVVNGGTLTLSGAISGTGQLQLASGSLALTGTNTYTGGTLVGDSNTLLIGSDAALGAAGTNLTLVGAVLSNTATATIAHPIVLSTTDPDDPFADAGGTIAPAANTVLTISSVISGGDMPLYIAGPGTLVLSAANSYALTYIYGGGKLSVGADANLGGNVTISNGTLATTGNIRTGRSITVDGGSQTFDVASGTTLTLTGHLQDLYFSQSGVVNHPGSGMIKAGAGKLVLALPPDLPQFPQFPGIVFVRGLTEVAAGTLENDSDMIGPVQVDSGAYLQGTGDFRQGFTILSGGHYKAGNSPGTANIGGPVAFAPGTFLEFDIDGTGITNGAGNYSRLVFSGPGAILTAGGILQPTLRGITGSGTNAYTPPVGQQFNIVHTDAGVIGSFDTIEQPSAGLGAETQFDAVYSGTDVNLVVTPVSYTNLAPLGVSDTANRRSIGASIDSYRLAPGLRMTGDRNTVLTALYGLPADQIGPALDQMAGTVHGDAMSTALGLSRMFGTTTADHRDGGGMSAATIEVVPAGGFAAIGGVASPRNADLVTGSPFWVTGLGAWSRTDSDGNAPGYRSTGGGVMVGLDLVADENSGAGIAAAYATSGVDTSDSATATVQTERLIAYGDLATDEWRFTGELAAAVDHFSTRRLIQIGALSRTAGGKAGGWAFSADAGVRYGDGAAVPFLEGRYDHISRDRFLETGAGDLSLAVDGASIDAPSLLTGVDVDVPRTFGKSDPLIALNARFAWAHDFGEIDGTTNAVLVGVPAVGFVSRSSRGGQDAGIVNVKLASRIDDAVSMFAALNVEIRRRQVTSTLSAGLKVDW